MLNVRRCNKVLHNHPKINDENQISWKTTIRQTLTECTPALTQKRTVDLTKTTLQTTCKAANGSMRTTPNQRIHHPNSEPTQKSLE
jgi:hypothetical protein